MRLRNFLGVVISLGDLFLPNRTPIGPVFYNPIQKGLFKTHVLPGLLEREGPILTVANWSGEWPGLVGMLNLNGSLLQKRCSAPGRCR